MQEDLSQRLARELRKETCPQRVIDDTLRKIAAETPPPSRLRYVIPAAFAAIVLLSGLLLLSRSQPTGGSVTPQAEVAELQSHDRKQVARDAETALGLIGTVLLDAGARSETVVSDSAIPPLRHSFDTARNKIIHHTQP